MVTPATDTPNSEHYSAPPEWIAVIVLIGSMVVIALMVIVLRQVILRAPNLPPRTDIESTPGFTIDYPVDRLALNTLDRIAPAKTYKKLKAESPPGQFLPDQSGPSVEW